MSLFDLIKDKATELLGGASEKVADVTGVDLPVGEAAQSVADVTESGQDVVDTGRDAVEGTGLLGDAGPDPRA